MLAILKNGTTAVVVRVKLRDATTGLAKTALNYQSAGLAIGTIADNESASTAYSGSNLQTITTIGAWTAPAAGKARFAEVNATNHPGLYEIHLADARFAVSGARALNVTVQATGCFSEDALIQLPAAFDPHDARLGLTSIPTANPNATGGLPTLGSGSGQINPDGSGNVKVGAYAAGQDPAALLGTGSSLTALATQASASAIKAKTDTLPAVTDLLEADRVIDTSVVPWALVLVKKGSGALGQPGAVELLRQKLHDVSGGSITNTSTILGQSIT